MSLSVALEVRKVANGYVVADAASFDRGPRTWDGVHVFETFDAAVAYLRAQFGEDGAA